MKFKISRTSQPNYYDGDPPPAPCPGAVLEDGSWWLEVSTMSALVELAEKHSRSKEVIVTRCPRGTDDAWELELYDSYRE